MLGGYDKQEGSENEEGSAAAGASTDTDPNVDANADINAKGEGKQELGKALDVIKVGPNNGWTAGGKENGRAGRKRKDRNGKGAERAPVIGKASSKAGRERRWTRERANRHQGPLSTEDAPEAESKEAQKDKEYGRKGQAKLGETEMEKIVAANGSPAWSTGDPMLQTSTGVYVDISFFSDVVGLVSGMLRCTWKSPTACPTTTGSFSDTNEKHGIHRYRAGRVRALFTLPAHLRFYYSGELAYLELFESFDVSASPFTKLYSTRPDFDSKGLRQTLVIPVTDIVFATHLVPKFHTIENQLELNRYVDLLDTRGNFWLNHYYNHHFYQYIQYWRRHRPRLQDRLLANLQRSRFPRLAGERESQEDSSDSSVTSQRWDPSASRQPEHQLDYERADKTARTFGLQ
ncbi:hypothetical protein RHS01_05179 [Rhizoctonia solani]|uniref:Uncharacterized protein n=1 Tax=Rhizoctonia solani TaxID=456999 RepID=A0A8H7IDK5_9AGAM|nr:hypothetical protein RHS01_05179 [Rhizoctonia solani]